MPDAIRATSTTWRGRPTRSRPKSTRRCASVVQAWPADRCHCAPHLQRLSCPAQNSAVSANQGRSGFTREYGSGGNGERRVGIGQQGRPFRG
ncbi:hypothetical protein FGL97_10345 [Pseudomonas putida]|nr:hypothetical protein [Pseudomonas putida]